MRVLILLFILAANLLFAETNESDLKRNSIQFNPTYLILGDLVSLNYQYLFTGRIGLVLDI